MPFKSLGLEPQITSKLTYKTPTPIQEQTIPAIMAGKDVLGLAQTGTGKTAAFALPIIQKLMSDKSRGVKALIVAPTRELANQLKESFVKYSEGTNLITTAIFGGVPLDRQLKRLRSGVDIVIGCPGRLLDHVRRGSMKLNALQYLVLDEADHMFDMGFLPDIKRLVAAVPAKRQTLLFSATMPEEIESLARNVLKDPVTVRIATQKAATLIKQVVFETSPEKKSELLIKLVEQYGINAAIVFARTKHRVQSLARSLANSGFKVAELQGNLSHQRRKMAIDGFKAGQFTFLVATDLAARGLDISELDYVVNYDIPQTVDSYVHRIGRTGRAARDGKAFTFVSRVDQRQIRTIEKVLGTPIDREVVEGFTVSESDSAGRQSSPRSRSRARDDRPSRSEGRSFRSADRSESRGDRPATRDDRPARSFDRPLRGSDRPERAASRPDSRNSDRPTRRGDRPARSSDRPFRSAGRTENRGDRVARRDDRPARSADRPERRDDRPARSGDRPFRSAGRDAGSSSRSFGRPQRRDSGFSDRRSSGRDSERSSSSSEPKRFDRRSDSKPASRDSDKNFSKPRSGFKSQGFGNKNKDKHFDSKNNSNRFSKPAKSKRPAPSPAA